VSPVDDSRIATARLSDPENDPPLKPTDADALACALPVWNVPPDAVNERTNVRVCRSQIGVKDASYVSRTRPLTLATAEVTERFQPARGARLSAAHSAHHRSVGAAARSHRLYSRTSPT
jgi:hypothetical protein